MKALLVIISLLFFQSVAIYSQPYAPVSPVPKNPKNDPEIKLWAAFIKDAKVPDKNVVPVPPYPGAEIIQTTKGQGDMLPSIRLVTKDDLESVVDFYKRELKKWKNENVYGVYMFWKGGDKMKAMMGGDLVVQIEPADNLKKSFPSAKTKILVNFKQK